MTKADSFSLGWMENKKQKNGFLTSTPALEGQKIYVDGF
jgi:hypothetical protein